MDENKRSERAKALRYKKPVATNLNLWQIQQDLEEMEEVCYDIQWYVDSTDEETMIANMDGDEDEAYEFKMAFSDLEAWLLQFQEDLQEQWVPECFDELIPAMRQRDYGGYLGFDEYEGDYFGINPYQYDMAEDGAEKRVCRLTKKELLEACGQTLNVITQYVSLKYRYDCLKTAFDVIKGENVKLMRLFRSIEEQYEKANEESRGFKYDWGKEINALDSMLMEVPQEYWMRTYTYKLRY